MATSLRAAGADCTLVGVDTFNSVLFGHDGPRKLRGLGNTIMPGNLKHALFDEVHWVSAELADHFTRKLYASTGHFRGPTTGAAYAVVRSVRDRCPDTPIVFLAPTTVPATSARPSPRIPTVPHTIDFVRSRSGTRRLTMRRRNGRG